MAADPQKTLKDLADGMLYDMRKTSTSGALLDLQTEGGRANSPLTDYKAWRKAFDAFTKSLGIERLPIDGIKAPNGLKPEGFKTLSVDQLKLLVSFSNPTSRKQVQSSQAKLFLGDFHQKFAPFFQESICESLLKNAADKFTALWAEYAPILKEITAKNEYSSISLQDFVKHLNELATDPSFYNNNLTPAVPFKADPINLSAALKGHGNAASQLAKLDLSFNILSDLKSTASRNNDWKYHGRLDDMQRAYSSYTGQNDVKSTFEEYRKAAKELDAMQADQSLPLSQGRQFI